MNLRVARGEVRAVIGPNGAGKTTLFNVLTGRVARERGVVLFKGEPIQGLPAHRIWRRGMSWTFQVAGVFSSLTVLENVRVPFLSHDGRRHDLVSRVARLGRERARAVLREVELGGLADQPCAALAYADLKRLELAIALAGQPDLLLLDEPTAGMGADEREALMALVRRVVRERSMTVLFTEHDMDVVFATAQAITVLHQGRVCFEGPMGEVATVATVRRKYLMV